MPDPAITVRTLADQTATCLGRTDFTLQSLDNGDKFAIVGVLVVPYFSDDENIIPHAVDVTKLKHFEGVEIPIITNRKQVDILIGQFDKALLTVLEEHEGAPDEPNLVFTRLGPAASGGRVHSSSDSLRALRVETIPAESNCVFCDKLQQALVTAKDALREVRSLDEEVQQSKNDGLACKLVEPFVKPAVTVHKISCALESALDSDVSSLDKFIDASPSLYVLKKRCAYLTAFTKYVEAIAKGSTFKKFILDATYLDYAFKKIVKYVQFRCFGAAVELLSKKSPDEFDSIIKRLYINAKDPDSSRHLNEFKTLRNLHPCVGSDNLLRVEGRLENASLPVNAEHPIILPGRHPLTRLIVLNAHERAGHGGPKYTLTKTLENFWIIHGNSSVKHYIADCGKCAILKAKPIRQLMADLPACRVTVCIRPFKFSGIDYLGPYLFRQNRSECKAWGLLFTCLCTRCLHVELVSSRFQPLYESSWSCRHYIFG